MSDARTKNPKEKKKEIDWMSDVRIKDPKDPKEKIKKPSKRFQRSEYFHDFGSIIHLAQFRRLSNKTQVYSLPVDNVRNRLTHSLEVSHVALQLWRVFLFEINKKFKKDHFLEKNREFCIDSETIVECASLAHDIGHPPFAHTGENTLSKEIETINKRFDSNVQNLRILTYLHPVGQNYRLKLTSSVLDAVIKHKHDEITTEEDLNKYKDIFSEAEKKLIEEISNNTKTFITDKKLIGELFKDAKRNCVLKKPDNIPKKLMLRHPIAYFMTAADDISYISSDIEDALKRQDITIHQLIEMLSDSEIYPYDKDYKPYEQLSKHKGKRVSKKILKNIWDKKLREGHERDNYGSVKSSILRFLFARSVQVVREIVISSKEKSSLDFLQNLHIILLRNSISRFECGKEFGNFLYMKCRRGDFVLRDPNVVNYFKKEKFQKILFKAESVQDSNAKAVDIVSALHKKLVPNATAISALRDQCEDRYAFLPQEYSSYIKELLKSESIDPDAVRFVFIDYIAGMTDRYAVEKLSELKRSPAVKKWR